MSKCIRLLCDTPDGIRECLLQLPDSATIAAVLAAARPVLGDGAADWESVATGSYGRVHARHYVPADGERIELYRPLQVDPRSARRARAARARNRSGSGGSGRGPADA